MNDTVVVKLTCGDTFMAVMLEDASEYVFQDLVAIKVVQIVNDGAVIEKTVTHPFCSLSLERIYRFKKDLVLFCQPLSPKIADHYVRLAAAFHEESKQDHQFESQEDEPEEEPDDLRFVVIPDNKNIH